MNQDFNENNNHIAELNAQQLDVEREFRLWYNQRRLAKHQRLMSFQESTTETQQQQQQQQQHMMLPLQQPRTPNQQQYQQQEMKMIPRRQQDMMSSQQPMLPNQPSSIISGQPMAAQHQSMGSSPQSVALHQPFNAVAHQPRTPQQLLTPDEPFTVMAGNLMTTQHQNMGPSPQLMASDQPFNILAHQHSPSPQHFILPNESFALMAQHQSMGSVPQHPMMLAQQPPMSDQYPNFSSPTQQVPMTQYASQYQVTPVSHITSMGLLQNQPTMPQMPISSYQQLPMGLPQSQFTELSQYPHPVQVRSHTPSPPQPTYKDVLKQALLSNKKNPKTKTTPTKSTQSKNSKNKQHPANDRKRKTQAGPIGPKKSNGPQEEDERPAKRHKSTSSVPVVSNQTGPPNLRLGPSTSLVEPERMLTSSSETDAQNKAHIVKDTADSAISVNQSPDFLQATSQPAAQASSPSARQVPDIDQDDSDTDEIPLPPPKPIKTPRVYKQKESTQGRMAAPDVAPQIPPQPVCRPVPQSAPELAPQRTAYVTPERAAEVAAEIVAEVAAAAARGAAIERALEHAFELEAQENADIAAAPAPGNAAAIADTATTWFNFPTGDEIDPELETETALPTFFEDAFASYLQDSEYYTMYQPAHALNWPSAPAPRRIHNSATDELLSMSERQVLYQRGNRMYAVFNNEVKLVAHADTRMGRRIWVDPETGIELESIDRGQGLPLEGENGAFVGFAGSRGAALMYGAGGPGLDK